MVATDTDKVIETRIQSVKSRIEIAARAAGRDPQSVRLVVITKTHEAPKIAVLKNHGISEIGENRVQELLGKYPDVGSLFKIHMVGHLQSNKVKQVVPMVSMVQSVDSEKIAMALEKECTRLNKPLDVLVQVNTSGEQSKSGVEAHRAPVLAEKIMECKWLDLRGLMTIGTFGGDEDETRRCFQSLRKIQNVLKTRLPHKNISELSMGMTDDFEIAIQEGATIIRIGSAIMGERRATA